MYMLVWRIGRDHGIRTWTTFDSADLIGAPSLTQERTQGLKYGLINGHMKDLLQNSWERRSTRLGQRSRSKRRRKQLSVTASTTSRQQPFFCPFLQLYYYTRIAVDNNAYMLLLCSATPMLMLEQMHLFSSGYDPVCERLEAAKTNSSFDSLTTVSLQSGFVVCKNIVLWVYNLASWTM